MNLVKITVLAAALAATHLTATAAEPLVEPANLQALSKAARTPADHAKVARQFRLQAEQYEAKAARHDAEVRALQNRWKAPLAHKWPAMANHPQLDQHRSQAIEARRAANECRQQAERHYQASIEKQYAEDGASTEP